MATEKVTIPDFGDVQDIAVVEIYVSPGDRVEVEDPLIALESEKAVMDIPSTVAGVVKEVYVQEEDSVGSGDAIVLIELTDEGEEKEEVAEQQPEQSSDQEKKAAELEEKEPAPAPPRQAAPSAEEKAEEPPAQPGDYHATPSVRAYAREQEVELNNLKGSGPKGRILKEDVDAYKSGGTGRQASAAEPASPKAKAVEDFSRHGAIEEMALSRIKKISGPQLQQSWSTIPHVTHFDEADVSELESFRRRLNSEAGQEDVRYSALVFIVKAVVATLKAYPHFNSSLAAGGDKLVIKRYYHIGIAVDTPQGLMVPVIKDADRKGMKEIATELKRLSEAARQGKLAITDLQGASFTISSLGGIGGTGFTPIVNSPQVAILGLSRNYFKPVWQEDQQVFRPQLTLPFSLSYDHRVVDGAEAARFCRTLSSSITDLRRALL